VKRKKFILTLMTLWHFKKGGGMKYTRRIINRANPGGIALRIILLYIIVVFLILPNLNMIIGVFYKDGGFNATIFKKLIGSSRAMRAMRNSFVLAISMAFTVNIVGALLVFFTEYIEIKGAKLLNTAYMSTLIYGGMVMVVSYRFIYGSKGIITQNLLRLFPGINPQWFTGYIAVLFIMTFGGTGNHLIFLTNSIRSIDYQTIEAARNLGASPLKTFISVVLPVLKPTFFAVTILTFLSGLGAVSAPLVVGGRDFQTINPLILEFSKDLYSRELASLMAIILGAATIILLVILNKFEKKGNYISISKVKSPLQKIKIFNPIINMVVHVLAYLLFVIYALPVVLAIIYSFSNSRAILSGQLHLSDFTFENYQKLIQSAVAYRPLLLSMGYSLSATAIAVLVTVVACRIIHKGRDILCSCLEYGMLIPWLLPGTMIALGLMIYFGNSHFIIFNRVLIGTVYLLIIAYAINKLPFSLRMIRASLFAVDNSLEEAAKSLGAGPTYRFYKPRRKL
jgi:iron(III) transport system permease protein